MTTKTTTALLLLISLSLSAVGCDDKNKTSPAPAASSLAPSQSPPSANLAKFTIDPESKTTLEMEAPKDTIKATATGGAGTLEIDFKNVKSSRGEVKIHLTTLVTNTFSGDKESDNPKQTAAARVWLEVADGSEGPLDPKVKETNRWAVYAIRSIESSTYSDVTAITPVKEGGDDVRTVSLVTKGELLIHGRKAEQKEAEVDVAFHYDAGAKPDQPKSLTIKSKKPFKIALADHDVKPRDNLGKLAKGSYHLLGTKVADNADVALDLRAKPKS